MIRIIRHWFKVKCLDFEIGYNLAVRKYDRDARNARARRAAQTKLESTIAQQKQFWGLV